LLESTYEQCLARELIIAGMPHWQPFGALFPAVRVSSAVTLWRSAERQSHARCIVLLGGDRLEQPMAIPVLFLHVMLDELLRIIAEL
jgi:hypothetical protein